MDLRDYQEDLLLSLRAKFKAGMRRVVAYLPTGGGKTELAVEIIDRHLARGGRVMFVVHLLELIEQTSRRFDAAGIDHGIIQGQHWRADSAKPVQVCSVQTLNRRLYLPDSTLIVIDEAHHAVSPTYRNFIRRNSAQPIIGLTATPFAKGMAKVDTEIGGPLWEDIVAGTTIRELTEQKWLVPADIYAPSAPDLTGVRTTAGDFNEADLSVRTNDAKLVGDIVEHWQRLANGMATVCFAVDIAHSKHIVQRFVERAIPAEHIDCYTTAEGRAEILARLRNGQTKVVSNCAVLAEGFDMPAMGAMILARPTKSLIRYLQMIGRALRPADGKSRALVLDHSGTVQRLGFPDDDLPLMLDDGKPNEHGKAKPAEKLPQPCGKCAYVKPIGMHECPSCGFAPERKNAAVSAPGTLTLVKRYQHRRVADKQQIYSQLLTIQRERGYAEGWIGHKFKAYFGVWPRSMSKVEIEPSREVRDWVLGQQIRFAKSKHKTHVACPRCGSTAVTRARGVGPHAAKATCNRCGMFWWLAKSIVEAEHAAAQSA